MKIDRNPKTELGLNFANDDSKNATGNDAEKAERQVPIDPL